MLSWQDGERGSSEVRAEGGALLKSMYGTKGTEAHGGPVLEEVHHGRTVTHG